MPRSTRVVLILACSGLTGFSLAGPAAAASPVSENPPGTTVLFEDDFESYDVNTFPSAGGWGNRLGRLGTERAHGSV